MRKSTLIIVLLVLTALVLAACGGGSEPEPAAPAESSDTVAAAGDAAKGEELYTSTCIACHGEGGVGVQGLGKDMTTSAFIAEKTDAEMVEFIKVGRDPSDELNTTGVAMPSKGGNPALTEEQMLDVVAYIRTLQQ